MNSLDGTDREFFIINLLVRMIRWTGLASWEFEFPFPGSLTSTFLVRRYTVQGLLEHIVHHNVGASAYAYQAYAYEPRTTLRAVWDLMFE